MSAKAPDPDSSEFAFNRARSLGVRTMTEHRGDASDMAKNGCQVSFPSDAPAKVIGGRERTSNQEGLGMEYSSYDRESLKLALDGLERRYGLPSSEFYEAFAHDVEGALDPVPGFVRSVWASIYAEHVELSEPDQLAAQVDHTAEFIRA